MVAFPEERTFGEEGRPPCETRFRWDPKIFSPSPVHRKTSSFPVCRKGISIPKSFLIGSVLCWGSPKPSSPVRRGGEHLGIFCLLKGSTGPSIPPKASPILSRSLQKRLGADGKDLGRRVLRGVPGWNFPLHPPGERWQRS